MDNIKIRLLGYYSYPNQKMNPESEQIEEANRLAPLLESSIFSLYKNPETDEELKKAIESPTVFVFKDEEGNLCAYFSKDKTVRITGVVESKHLHYIIACRFNNRIKYSLTHQQAWTELAEGLDIAEIVYQAEG